MHKMSFQTAITLAAFLSATLVAPVHAAPSDQRPAVPAPVSTFRASIDQAAAQAAPLPVPPRRHGDVRKQMMGGGGGGGMMVMTLLITAASLAGTYFLVKEMKKSTGQATTGQ